MRGGSPPDDKPFLLLKTCSIPTPIDVIDHKVSKNIRLCRVQIHAIHHEAEGHAHRSIHPLPGQAHGLQRVAGFVFYAERLKSVILRRLEQFA